MSEVNCHKTGCTGGVCEDPALREFFTLDYADNWQTARDHYRELLHRLAPCQHHWVKARLVFIEQVIAQEATG